MAEVLVEFSAAPEVDQIDDAPLCGAVRAALKQAAADGHLPDHAVLTAELRLTTDEEIHELNRSYRAVDRPTDVLSFSFIEDDDRTAVRLPDDWPLNLGQIVISLPYATRQAADLGHSIDMELAWLAIHGALQLVGYAHAEEGEALHMERLERAALHSLDFDPD